VKRLTISGHACTETLALLIAMAWADGRLDDSEREGVRGAAQILNLPKAFRDRLDKFLERPSVLDQLLFEPLSGREKAFAFVAAAWMARIDGTVHPKEQGLLDDIGAALGFAKERQTELADVAAKLEPLPGGARAWSQEITTLFKAIPAELEEPGTNFEVAFE
jgi:uncharacterized membrane protein YebE (DUF533 family)